MNIKSNIISLIREVADTGVSKIESSEKDCVLCGSNKLTFESDDKVYYVGLNIDEVPKVDCNDCIYNIEEECSWDVEEYSLSNKITCTYYEGVKRCANCDHSGYDVDTLEVCLHSKVDEIKQDFDDMSEVECEYWKVDG